MADYPAHLIHGHRLIDGRRVAIRPVMLRFARGLGFTVTAVPEDRTTMCVVKEL